MGESTVHSRLFVLELSLPCVVISCATVVSVRRCSGCAGALKEKPLDLWIRNHQTEYVQWEIFCSQIFSVFEKLHWVVPAKSRAVEGKRLSGDAQIRADPVTSPSYILISPKGAKSPDCHFFPLSTCSHISEDLEPNAAETKYHSR